MEALPAVSPRVERAIQVVDAINSEDPHTAVVRGVTGPKELLHGRLAFDRVRELDPSAGETALVAARAHHLRRWAFPRSEYPDGRAGYLRWRAEAKRRHAAAVGEILVPEEWDTAEVDRVRAIVEKVGLGSDPVVQTHEDALCLVFLELQLTDVVEQLGRDHATRVLSRTMTKMSRRARDMATSMSFDSPPLADLVRSVAAGVR